MPAAILPRRRSCARRRTAIRCCWSVERVNATFFEKLNFNFIRDIAPVAGIMRVPFVMEVNPSVPAKTVPEFIAYAKANPGKINMASAGTGGVSHVYGELFKIMTGVNMVHVPYRGAAPALTDLLGGQVQIYFGTVTVVDRLHQGGQAACAGGDHVRRVPRCYQSCRPWLNSCRATRRASGPASARPRIRPLRSSTSSTGRSMRPSPIPKMKARLADLGGTVLAGSPADFGKLIADETEKWGKVVKFAGIKAE